MRARVRRSGPRAALVTCVLVLLAASAAIAQSPAAPSTGARLVGHWMGQWRGTTGSTDSIDLTVDAVAGRAVSGHVFIAVTTPAQGYYNRDVPFSGDFDGAVLSIWLPPALFLSLTVTGDTMQGTVKGQQTFGTVELDRQR